MGPFASLLNNTQQVNQTFQQRIWERKQLCNTPTVWPTSRGLLHTTQCLTQHVSCEPPSCHDTLSWKVTPESCAKASPTWFWLISIHTKDGHPNGMNKFVHFLCVAGEGAVWPLHQRYLCAAVPLAPLVHARAGICPVLLQPRLPSVNSVLFVCALAKCSQLAQVSGNITQYINCWHRLTREQFQQTRVIEQSNALCPAQAP